MNELPVTERTRLRRRPERGVFDRDEVNKILDEAFICHVGFMVEGRPFVIPTAYGRRGDEIYIHGSAASRMMKTLEEDIDVCVTVTLLDALVLARSAFHHSLNYRSVVLFGKARAITDEKEKDDALRVFTDHVIAGRSARVRPPTAKELKATAVLALPIQEAVAKVRAGGVKDDEPDYALDVWAGLVPLNMQAGAPVPDDRLPPGVEPEAEVARYDRRDYV